ncbi:MAG: hypothetical protein Aurels2KO_09570 [Aureliella sp.]
MLDSAQNATYQTQTDILYKAPTMSFLFKLASACLACGFALLSANASYGQESATAEKPAATAETPETTEITARNERFSKMFSGSVLTGQFTVDGKPMNQLKEEAYEIVRARKLPKGDQWSIEARIKYGKYDLVVPVPLDVKWAGKTPVLTLDEITIPGMGTFSARVVLHGNKYAGTWQHDEVGGHMFGKITFPKSDDKPTDQAKK